MRKLTRAEIESGGAAMPGIMRFHDQLVGARLSEVLNMPADDEYPSSTALLFDDGALLFRQFDDEGNPGDTAWELCDAQGRPCSSRSLPALCGRRVVSCGYFHARGELREVVPCLELDDGTHITCTSPHGGGVICHTRNKQQVHNLLCHFNLSPKPKPRKTDVHSTPR